MTDNKDFIDEEFDKQEQKTDITSWYNRPAPVKEEKKVSKPLYIVLTCFVLIACIAFGWLLCYLVNDLTTPEEEKILRTVINYLKNNYYEDVDNWTEAIEYSGSALMQKAGDRFCQLMSPQTYYDYLYTTNEASDRVFGISFYVEEGLGLYVASVVTNSNAYGHVQEGDIVLKLSNVKGEDGEPIFIGGETFSQITLSEWSSVTIQEMLTLTDSATFHILRQDDSEEGYRILPIDLERSVIPTVEGNQYGFIEYYFGKNNTNISVEPMGKAAISTYEERKLNELPDDTGYVRITQFMDYVPLDHNGNYMFDNDGEIVKISASSEFYSVMEEFKRLGLKRLVLDLKGNPGGNVAYVSEIAGMLVTDVNLTPAQRQSVTNSKGELLMTYLEIPKPARVRDNHYSPSSYFKYFDAPSEKLSIVVWTDGGSASGSEMLTGVLLDYGTAVHMGTKTYGKGIAQAIVELPFTQTLEVKGEKIEVPWVVYYTCAKYYSPLGTNIHGEGYTPEKYNGLSSYEDLWEATNGYWK